MDLTMHIGRDAAALPYADVMAWHNYAEKRGGLPLQRLAYLLAQLCVMFNNANGGKASLRDFLPELPREPDKRIESADALCTALGF